MNSYIREIRQDISIAQHAIAESGLSSLFDSETLLCEVYRRPAHNRNTLYAIVIDSTEGIRVISARPEVFRLGLVTCMSSFKKAANADQHAGSTGRIVCSTRFENAVSSDSLYEKLKGLRTLTIPVGGGICIDDEVYFIRSRMGEVYFPRSSLETAFADRDKLFELWKLVEVVAGDAHV